MSQQPGDARQSRGEDESLEVFAPRDRVSEDHEQSRVALHRAAHVADEDQRPSSHTRLTTEESHELTARADRMAGRTPQVDPAHARRAQAPGPPFRHPPGRLLQQAPDLLGLGPGHLLEVFVAEQLLGAVAARAGWKIGRVLLAAHLGGIQSQRVSPQLRALGRKRQRATATGDDACRRTRVGRRPEDVKCRLEGRNVFLPAHEHGAQRIPKIALELQVDERERARGVGQSPRSRLESGVMQQTRERSQSWKQVDLRHAEPSRPTRAPGRARAPGLPGT